MPKKLFLTIAIILVLILSVGSIFWALHLNDAINNYRSPLANDPPAAGSSLGESLSRRVVFILVDGLREDLAYNSELMPVFNQLRLQGASATMHSRTPSFSTPSYGVLMTGAWPYLSDAPAMNLDYEVIPTMTQDNIFSAASRMGMKTGASGYNWFEKLIPAEDLSSGYFTPGEDDAADREVVDAALAWLDDPNYQLVLIHIDQVDHIEHVNGSLSIEASQAAKNADNYIKEIFAKLDLSQDTLLICADHRHIDQGGHGGPEAIVLQEPFTLVGAGIKPGTYADIQQVDVAPTISAILGTNIPATSQGRVLTDMLVLTPHQSTNIQEATKQQQEKLLLALETNLNRVISINENGDIVDSTQTAIENAIQTRLNSEQWPRLIISIAVVLVVISLTIWQRNKHTLSIILAVALNLVVFNIAYRFIMKNNYSFSSIKSITNMIVTYAVIGLICLAITSALLLWYQKVKLRKSGKTMRVMLSYTLLLQFVLFLPALAYYIIVGKTITWALPHITIQFWALHSLLQVALTGVFGLIIMGIALLIGAINKRSDKKKVQA
ncbi:MAG: alkaline phosphatase family protein [Anaerolineaceae bacterium]|nr:alkaline phosphatase family protein [Anaerolineaceae bacterium]